MQNLLRRIKYKKAKRLYKNDQKKLVLELQEVERLRVALFPGCLEQPARTPEINEPIEELSLQEHWNKIMNTPEANYGDHWDKRLNSEVNYLECNWQKS